MTHRYTYNLPLLHVLAIPIVGAGCLAFGGYTSMTSPTIKSWFLTAMGAGLFLVGVPLCISRFGTSRHIELEDDALLIPKGFLTVRYVRIPYADVERFWEAPIGSDIALYLEVNGEQHAIVERALPSKQSYNEIKALVASRTKR